MAKDPYSPYIMGQTMKGGYPQMLCPTCNWQLRYDKELRAYYCVDCDYLVVVESPRPTRKAPARTIRVKSRRVTSALV